MADSRICKIDGCDKPLKARGWCNAHWVRWKRYGDPLAGQTMKGEPSRFFNEVVLPYDGDECLIWPYSKDGKGYAQIRKDGRNQSVSNLVCREIDGPPPTPEHEAAHSCGKGHLGCVAPSHLSWKTHVDNEADKLIHDTHIRGERCGTSKLSESQVLQIRELIGRKTQREIAKMFGVCQATVSFINRRRRWFWL